MSAIKDGGPAFPRPGIPTNWAEGHHAHTGMTLRDYFAGQALAGVLSHQDIDLKLVDSTGGRGTAKVCYIMADAMLAAREGKP